MNKNPEPMTRAAFLNQLGLSGSALLAFYCMGTATSCSKPAEVAPAAGSANLSLDLTSSTYSGLKTVGQYVYVNNILVAHVKSGSYVALSKICTHEGSTVQYRLASDDVYCPDHKSIFTTTGSVTQGPANQSLTQYTTTVSADGNTLNVA